MSETIEGIWKNGVFRPLDLNEVPIREGEQVHLTFEATTTPAAEKILSLAAQVYQDLSDAEIAEIEQIANQRGDFFGKRSE